MIEATIFVVALILALISSVIAGLTENVFFGLAFFVGTFGVFLLQGLKKIKASPPHVGVLTLFGRRVPVLKREGFGIFPFYPFVFGVIPVEVEKVNQDLPEQLVRTPDLGELSIPVSLTWTPAKNDPRAMIEYLNCGGEEGVKNILADIVKERLREWAIAEKEGPQNWIEALKAQDEAAAILVVRIAGIEIEEAKRITPQIRRGNGLLAVPQLGIVLNRLNVGEIKPVGKLAEAAELKVKEKEEGGAELFELGVDLEKANLLLAEFEKRGIELTLLEAFQIIMSWKATREGHGFSLPGIPEALIELVKILRK